MKDAVDHTVVGEEDVVSVNLGLTATGSSGSATGAITVNIEDDSPVAFGDMVDTPVAPLDVNLMFIIDKSGSMAFDSQGRKVGDPNYSGPSRIELTKDAIQATIDEYGKYANVMVRLVTFNASAQTVGSTWMTATDAINEVEQLTANGGTNYDAAIGEAISAWNASGSIDGGINRAVFVTDGQPTFGLGSTDTLFGGQNSNGKNDDVIQGDEGIQGKETEDWQNFLKANDIDAQAFTIDTKSTFTNGSGGTITYEDILDPIAYNGETETNNDGVLTTAEQLKEDLLKGVNVGTSGNLLQGTLANGNSGFGADGGHIVNLTIDNELYAFTKQANGSFTLTPPAGATTPNDYIFSGDLLTVYTDKGGKFNIDIDDASYTYLAPKGIIADYQEKISYDTIDADGDGVSNNLTLDVYRFEARNDNIITNQTGSSIEIDQAVLLGNDDNNGDVVFDGVSNPTGGTVSGADPVVFNFGTTGSPFTGTAAVINELSGDAGYSGSGANNNTFASAQDLTDRTLFGSTTDTTAPQNVDGVIQYKGSISEQYLTSTYGTKYADYDYIKISLKQGETVTLDLDGAAPTRDTYLRLYDANQNELAVNDDATSVDAGSSAVQDSYLTHTANTTGDYYVRVASYEADQNSGITSSSPAEANYSLWIGVETNSEPGFDYTISEDSVNDSATVNIEQVTGTTITGTAGNDVLIGTDNQADTLNGGAGDDVLLFEAGDTINGGTGDDILSLNIEKVNMTDGKAQTLNISTQDVLDMTNTGKLFIDADSKDSIDQTGFTQQTNSDQTGYTMWTGNGATIDENVAAGNII